MAAITAFFEKTDVHQTVKPYSWDGPDGQKFPKDNFAMKDMEIKLTDIRTVPDFKPTLEENGFCFLENKSKQIGNTTGADDCKPYLEEMAQFLRERLGTKEVFPINANFRTSRSKGGSTGHLPFAHLDNTVASSWPRISLFLTEEERARVLSGQARARILNIWRPMFNHAEDIPFAVCDPKTNVDLSDVVSVDRITPGAVKEVAYFAWNPAHRWYWMSNQTPDEVVIMTQYDTHPPNGFFNIVPHAAFRNGMARPGCPARCSVEARFVVLEPAPYAKDGTGPGPNGPFPDERRAQPWREWVSPPDPEPAPAPTADSRPLYISGSMAGMAGAASAGS